VDEKTLSPYRHDTSMIAPPRYLELDEDDLGAFGAIDDVHGRQRWARSRRASLHDLLLCSLTMKTTALFLVFTLVLLFAACGDDESTSSTSTTSATTTNTTSTTTTSNGGHAGSGGSGTGGMTGAGGSTGGAGGSGAMVLTSSAFTEGGAIPQQYSCNGANVSPPLTWTPGPAGTMSYAIVFRDLDNSLGHAAIFDIPASTTSLPEDVDKTMMPADVSGALQCHNYTMTTYGYAGPCPGSQHTYQFTLYAINSTSLGLNASNVNVDAVDTAAQAAALASATLSGTYTP
jgi:Raf kinase inhibitor-like YbhB/YbcL family protein